MGRGHAPNGPARLSPLPELNRRRPTSSNLAVMGWSRCVPDSALRGRGTPGRDVTTDREAMVKICGVTVAMPQG